MKNSIKIAAFAFLVGLSTQGISVLNAGDRQSAKEARTGSDREVTTKAASDDMQRNQDHNSYDRNQRGVGTVLSSNQQGIGKGSDSNSREIELKKKTDSRESENRMSSDNTTSKSKW